MYYIYLYILYTSIFRYVLEIISLYSYNEVFRYLYKDFMKIYSFIVVKSGSRKKGLTFSYLIARILLCHEKIGLKIINYFI